MLIGASRDSPQKFQSYAITGCVEVFSNDSWTPNKYSRGCAMSWQRLRSIPKTNNLRHPGGFRKTGGAARGGHGPRRSLWEQPPSELPWLHGTHRTPLLDTSGSRERYCTLQDSADDQLPSPPQVQSWRSCRILQSMKQQLSSTRVELLSDRCCNRVTAMVLHLQGWQLNEARVCDRSGRSQVVAWVPLFWWFVFWWVRN